MRLFVALELPLAVVTALEDYGAAVSRPGLRVLPPASLHVTLAFLGERPDEEVQTIAAALAPCARPVPGLTLAAPAWLGRGSALSVDLHDASGACAALQRCASAALEALGAYTPEVRPFRPHVTVARVRRGSRVDRSLPEPPSVAPFEGKALTLFQSHLSPAGARYAPLARVTLPRA